MSLPPVVSDPEVCHARIEDHAHTELPHDWTVESTELAGPTVSPDSLIEVCRFCDGRKP